MRKLWACVCVLLCLSGCAAPIGENPTEPTPPATHETIPTKIEETTIPTESIKETTAPTESETEPPTEPETEPPTESETEPPTQPETEPPTQPETEPPTQPETEPPTQPETQPPTKPASRNGWQTRDGKAYYFLENGEPATGRVEIDGEIYYFSSQGEHILLANPWNFIPDDYDPDLVELSLAISVEDCFVDRSCYDALVSMMNACNKECPEVCVVSAYRTMEHQTRNFNNKVNYYLEQGYDRAEAERLAAKVIAVPGTSEHQLGLAVDIIDTRLWALEEEQADLPAQKWLMKNCWKYGFILRYPKEKTDVTGIIYEPWHYRYVGKAIAKELHESGLTLEEYLSALTP